MGNIIYETKVGSHVYGTNTENSDLDIYSIYVPPKNIVFPDFILGFGKQPTPIGIKATSNNGIDKQSIPIVKYFHLCMSNNPTMLDSLYTEKEDVLIMTPLAEYIREHRSIFLSKELYKKFGGYSYSEYLKNVADYEKNKQLNIKSATHCVRLLLEGIQLLETGTLKLKNPVLKTVMGMDYPTFLEFYKCSRQNFDIAFHKSKLQEYPDEERIKDVLMDCLQTFYEENPDVVSS